jgi:methenyltetrahydromethanopterin cyclohydrolase
MPIPTLNDQAQRLAEEMGNLHARLRIAVHLMDCRAPLIDCGVQVEGGLQAGLFMARISTAGYAEVALVTDSLAGHAHPHIQIMTDQPLLACLACQYAGWEVRVNDYFAMGSGPMRALCGREALFDRIPGRESASAAVGVLECRRLPTDAVFAYLGQHLSLPAQNITLLAAPAASLAGTVQVVARSLETALHKLLVLDFNLTQVISGFGVAPLPPVSANEITAIGRANDAIIYGANVFLWVRSDDDLLAAIGPKVVSESSGAYGETFCELFERGNRDFYKMDPMLFSPARATFHNLKSGRTHSFGRPNESMIQKSFFGDA